MLSIPQLFHPEAQAPKHPSETAPRNSGDHTPPQKTFGGGTPPIQNPHQTQRTDHHHDHNRHPETRRLRRNQLATPTNKVKRDPYRNSAVMAHRPVQPHRLAPRLAPTTITAEPQLSAFAPSARTPTFAHAPTCPCVRHLFTLFALPCLRFASLRLFSSHRGRPSLLFPMSY